MRRRCVPSRASLSWRVSPSSAVGVVTQVLSKLQLSQTPSNLRRRSLVFQIGKRFLRRRATSTGFNVPATSIPRDSLQGKFSNTRPTSRPEAVWRRPISGASHTPDDAAGLRKPQELATSCLSRLEVTATKRIRGPSRSVCPSPCRPAMPAGAQPAETLLRLPDLMSWIPSYERG